LEKEKKKEQAQQPLSLHGRSNTHLTLGNKRRNKKDKKMSDLQANKKKSWNKINSQPYQCPLGVQ